MQTVPPVKVLPSHPPDTSSTKGVSVEYDFIIIGGGTAGLCLAARLTEDPSAQVLVVEAGANRLNDPAILAPGRAFSLYDNPDYDWTFQTVPQVSLCHF